MTVDVGSQHVRVPKAGELVAAQLRRQIVTGELSPGDPLPSEAALMDKYGVSRPTLREAFRILESESIIRVLRGAHGGARVLAPSTEVAALTGAPRRWIVYSVPIPVSDLIQRRYDSPSLLGAN